MSESDIDEDRNPGEVMVEEEEEEEEEEAAVKWKEEYNSTQKILLVGEGDFSFSLCLAKAFVFAPNLFATCLDSSEDLAKKYTNGLANVRELKDRRCLVFFGVDATQMSQHYFLTTHRFDRIIFNLPHVGFLFPENNACQITLNNELIKGFLENAKVLLKKGAGEIHVTHKLGEPYDKWDLVGEANKVGLVLHDTKPFFKDKYSGYGQKRAHGSKSDESFRLGPCATFKFRRAPL